MTIIAETFKICDAVEQVLMPEIFSLNKDICICSIQNIPNGTREIIQERIESSLWLTVIIERLAQNEGYSFDITSDKKHLVFCKTDLIEDIVIYCLENNQNIPINLTDYLYEQFVKYSK